MLGSDNDLLRSFASFFVFKELVMKRQIEQAERRSRAEPRREARNEQRPAWPARRRFWHRSSAPPQQQSPPPGEQVKPVAQAA